MPTDYACIDTGASVTAVIEGRSYTVREDHPSFTLIRNAIRAELPGATVEKLFDTVKAIESYACGKVEVREGKVYHGGTELHSQLTERITSLMREGYPCEYLCRFLDRLMANPSERARKELYEFLKHKDLAITPTGMILGYKSIRSDWTDERTGVFNNRPGQTLEMPRGEVDDDRERTCSYGFHFGSIQYCLTTMAHARVVVVEVDPADVVSIPADHDAQKCRTCKYRVVCEYQGVLKPVADGDEPYREDEEEDEWLEEEDDDGDW